jgi:hypothetical protein
MNYHTPSHTVRSSRCDLMCDAARPADAARSSITALPVDNILTILEMVGPRTVIRLGNTCRGYRDAAVCYKSTPSYARMLVREAVKHLNIVLSRIHSECGKADILTPKIATHASRIADLLAEGPRAKALPDWSRAECLRILYPCVFGFATWSFTDWRFAPYALEWCALHEAEVLREEAGAAAQRCPPSGPRLDLLELLRRDAGSLPRLAAVARDSNWPAGKTFAVTMTASCSTLDAGTVHFVHASLKQHMAFATLRVHKGPAGSKIFSAVVDVVADSFVSDYAWQVDNAGRRVSFAQAVDGFCRRVVSFQGVDVPPRDESATQSLETLLPPEDQAWLCLAGLGDSGAARSLKLLIDGFDCKVPGWQTANYDLHRADFDGDQMNIWAAHEPDSRFGAHFYEAPPR